MNWLLFILGAVASGFLAVCFMFFKSFGMQDLMGFFFKSMSKTEDKQVQVGEE